MDDLIVRELQGDLSPFEKRQLDRWREAAPDNEQRYREVEALWGLTEPEEASGDHSTRGPGAPAMDAGSAPPDSDDIRRTADRRRSRSRFRERATSPWTGFGLAAAAVLALIWIGVRALGGPGGPGTDPFAATEFAAGPDRTTTMTLSDGSVMRLAPGARARFVRTAEARRVELEGRAFFAVTPDSIAFVVSTRAGDARVLGTRFEVASEADSVRLVVVEGRVRLSGPGGSSDLSADQVGTLVVGSAPTVRGVEDALDLLDWTGGLLVFRSTPLRQVARELARHFGVAVNVTSPDLAGRRITAWFEDEPLEDVIDEICVVAGVECEVGPTTVTVGR